MNYDKFTDILADAAYAKIAPILTSYMDQLAAAEKRIFELELMVAEQRGVIKAQEEMMERDLRARLEFHQKTYIQPITETDETQQ